MSSMGETKMPNEADESSGYSTVLEQCAEYHHRQLEELVEQMTKERLARSQKLLESGCQWIEFLTSKLFQAKKDDITQASTFLRLNTNTSGAEARMRVLTKELFEMVLDMTISDITEFLHYESGIVTTEDMTGAGQDQIEKQRRAMEGQEIRKRQVMLGKIASDLLSQARTGMERRIEQLKETAGDGLSREEASDDDVKGASQDETVAASTA